MLEEAEAEAEADVLDSVALRRMEEEERRA
jgi:hypothetical protein